MSYLHKKRPQKVAATPKERNEKYQIKGYLSNLTTDQPLDCILMQC